MSYNRKTWTNRNSEHPYRRTLTDTTSGTSQTVDVTRTEGTITTEGDTFDANTMNNMEGRIADQFSVVDQRTGALTDLDTTDKSSLVAAINEVAQGGGGGGSSTLAGLTDTSISSPTNGQVLKYNSTSSKWENAEESGGGENYILFSGSSSSTLSNATTFSLSSYTDQDGNSVEFADLYSYLITNKYAAYLEIAFTDATIRLKSDCPYATSVNLVKIGFHLIGDLNRIYTIALNYSSQLVFTEIKALSQASDVYYSNSNSGLSSSNAQAAIDELANVIQSLEYQVGDTASLQRCMMFGYFNAAATALNCFIPLSKPISSDVDDISISGSYAIRVADGTSLGDLFTLGTTTTIFPTNGGLYVYVTGITASNRGNMAVTGFPSAQTTVTFSTTST